MRSDAQLLGIFSRADIFSREKRTKGRMGKFSEMYVRISMQDYKCLGDMTVATLVNETHAHSTAFD